jgi:O-antigen ligase
LFSEKENLSLRSISLRWAVIYGSFQAFLTNPILGAGLGDWANNLSNLGFIYPHNFFVEVFVEGGIFLGFLFCIPYVIFLKNPKSMLFLVSFYLLLSQQVSGDILDSRYWLVFSILCFCYKIDFRAIRSRPINNRFSKRLKRVNHN